MRDESKIVIAATIGALIGSLTYGGLSRIERVANDDQEKEYRNNREYYNNLQIEDKGDVLTYKLKKLYCLPGMFFWGFVGAMISACNCSAILQQRESNKRLLFGYTHQIHHEYDSDYGGWT